MRKIIVDIDNTLWDFASVFYERIKRINPDFPPPEAWNAFDFWKEYLSPREFYGIIKGIHMDQDQFAPYSDAVQFLSALKQENFYIIIASHREKGTFDVTARWLQQNNLLFDELHLSYDKTVLFDDCLAVIDDSPTTLHKAASAGVMAIGLRMPWNEGEGFTLFDSLTDILGYLQEQHDAQR